VKGSIFVQPTTSPFRIPSTLCHRGEPCDIADQRDGIASNLWTQGDTIQTPLGICKRFSATVTHSVARPPFTRPT
jgi:hypothetical protein